jgi:hypothetical protein
MQASQGSLCLLCPCPRFATVTPKLRARQEAAEHQPGNVGRPESEAPCRLAMHPGLPSAMGPYTVPKPRRHQRIAPVDVRFLNLAPQPFQVALRQLEHGKPDPFGQLLVRRLKKRQCVATLVDEQSFDPGPLAGRKEGPDSLACRPGEVDHDSCSPCPTDGSAGCASGSNGRRRHCAGKPVVCQTEESQPQGQALPFRQSQTGAKRGCGVIWE